MKKNIYLLPFAFLMSCLSFGQENKLDLLQENAFQFIFTDQTKALDLIDSLNLENKNLLPKEQSRNLSLKGVYYGVQNELDSAAHYFQKALKIIPKEEEFYPKLVNNLAITYKKKGEYQEALSLLLDGLEVARENNNLDALQKIYSEMSSCYRAINNYNLAVEYSLKSIETENKKKQPNAKSIAFEKQKTANLYGLLGNYGFAEEIYEEIIDYFNESPYQDANVSTFLNYANALIKLDKVNEAFGYIKKAKKTLKDFKNDELFAFLKLTEANYYASINQNNKAKECYEKSLASFQQHQDNYLKTVNEYLSFLSKNNSFEEIVNLSKRVEDKDLSKFGILDLIEYKNNIGEAHENLSKFKQASVYYKTTIQLKDSLQKLENFQIAKDLQAKYQNEIIDQRNTILQERVVSETRKTLAVLGFSLAIGILLVSIIFRYRIQFRNKNKLAKALQEKLEAENELIILKDALLQQQKKELLSKSYENISLEKKIANITKKIPKIDRNTYKEIKEVKSMISPEDELNKLKFEFERLYPNFREEIHEIYPELSKNDLLFLSFIKLKFTYKEIATILSITHQSVITKKYRIVKKMKLSSEIDLYDFIINESYKSFM
ncbi:tetratricopeptide repeat protein [Psychroflexus maritimus]|uniref:Tetratricopeptide repeat protein n=1 Tax=Psychroflexus maritimus TaxID=2714865 RepID=A0A967AGU3_9FLAO|nr:tetratricopeptide repeat protein [Psychroflexus maritimus]NGZ90226.1 tetratricopeptide repeat protein [Psychroflexus maritimus]